MRVKDEPRPFHLLFLVGQRRPRALLRHRRRTDDADRGRAPGRRARPAVRARGRHHLRRGRPLESARPRQLDPLRSTRRARREDHPHLWYRETNETATIDIGTGFARLTSWSPDGRYLAIGSDTELSSDPVYDFESVLYVQEVLDGELRTKWRFDEVTEPLHGGSWSFVWQP